MLVLPVGLDLENGYTIVHANGTSEPPVPATPAAQSGGAGTIYRASYRGMQDRAMKFLTATALPSERGQTLADFERTFKRERIFLARLSHSRIVRFYDFGILMYADRPWDYIVTEYIDGNEDLKTELARDKITGDQCFRLIGDVLRALRYMHSIGIGHGDVKYQNIRCRIVGEDRQAVLLDLGAAQQFDDFANTTEGRLIHQDLQADGLANVEAYSTDPLFIPTREKTHEALGGYINQPVSPSALSFIFPFHDIYCVGKLLQDLLKVESIAQKLEHALRPSGLNALDMIKDRLPNGAPRAHHYRTMAQLHDDWEKLRHGYLSPVDVPELSLASEFKYSIATPSGRVVITPRLGHLVQHKLFQRLRDLPQLELLKLRYMGASHTRQERSILTFRNARYYLAHLLNGPFFRLMAQKPELEATLLLALLRGIGHYQYSHFFEDYAAEQNSHRLSERPGMWRTIEYDVPTDRDLFLSAYDWTDGGGLRGDYHAAIQGAVEDSCRRLGGQLPKTLSNIVSAHFSADTNDAVRAIHAAHSASRTRDASLLPVHRVLAAILDSDIDADKVSYLTEDASETGVPYGSGIDLDGLLGALRAPSPPDLDRTKGPIIGITTKGLAAAESILICRNEMYERVYWHQSTRAMAAMVKYCLTRLFQSGAFEMPKFISETFFAEQGEVLRELWSQFQAIKRDGEVNPIASLLDGERGIYKPVYETRFGPLMAYSIEEIAHREDTLTELIRREFPATSIRHGELVIDLPIKERGMAATTPDESVYVYNGSDYGAGARLGEQTTTVEHIRQIHRQRSDLCRIYVSRRVFGLVPKTEELRQRIAESIG